MVQMSDDPTSVTVMPDPSFHTDLVATCVTCVVTKHIVSWTAEFGACRIEVIFITFNSNTVSNGSCCGIKKKKKIIQKHLKIFFT